jgi:hypothetical protein
MSSKKPNISGVSKDVTANIKKELIESEKEVSKKLLSGKKIAISISESENIKKLGFSESHIQDAIIEFARHLLVLDAQIVYGGDLRPNGYTHLFSELSFQYRDKSKSKSKHVANFSSYPIHLNLKRADELELKKNRVELIKIQPPKSIKNPPKEYFKADTLENKTIWADALTEMREEMNNYSDARVFMGGRSTGYSGKMPGLLEEATIAIRTGQPIYLIGAFGGITKSIIEAILGEKPEKISEKYQRLDDKYSIFLDHYKKQEELAYEKILANINSYGMEKLSEANGLTAEENVILFNTVHIPEMVFYVMKGLKNIIK